MKRLAITVISLFVVASAAHASMQVLPPVAPVAASPSAVAGGQKMIGWRSGPIICAGSPVVPSALPTPLERYGWISAEGVPTKSITLTFDIDRTGRPHAIKRSGPTYVLYGEDLDATLATARFAPGAERTGCTVTYDLDTAAIDAAPIDRLIAYSLFPVGQRLPQAGFDRVRLAASANSTCGDPAPAVRRRIYPDFKAIPQAPATRSWSMISFDIDAQGKPVKARVFRSTGNAALDRASVKAVADSRFEPGARRGCVYPYWRAGPTLAAPAIPDALAERADATCPATAPWKTHPVLRYPDAYRRQGVEGWGIVAYDVAPWGQTGNLRVVASEPSAAFGAAAMETVRAATKEASPQGYSNCVTRVRFVLAADGKQGPDLATGAPPPF
jgi:TonB family protein